MISIKEFGRVKTELDELEERVGKTSCKILEIEQKAKNVAWWKLFAGSTVAVG